MSPFVQKIRTFLNSPQGRRMVSEGQRQLAKPENQRRLRQMLTRLRGGHR
jgi:hypothetical protein